jgi:predicted PurR-regulated permease PerM
MTLLGRSILVALAVLAVALMAYLIYPFASALLVAAVLAAALAPWCERLATALGGRRTLSAAFVTAAVTLLLVLPGIGLTLTVVQQSVGATSQIRATLAKEGLAGVVDDLPTPLRDAARQVIERLPRREKQVEEMAGDQTGRMAGAVGGVLMATWDVLFQTAMMLVAFYFLLLDGADLVHWLTEVGPLKHAQMRELLADFRDVSVAVLVSSVVAAAIEAAVAGVGYLATGTPQALIFTFVTFGAAFVPVVGASAIVLAAAAFMFFTGHSTAALFLAFWMVVVSIVDHLVKPWLMKGRIEVNGGVVFFSLLCGVAMFGPAGLLAGPLIVAFFLSVVKMCQKELQAG